MAENKLTYIIVLNYNSSECTIQCMKSLLQLINSRFKIIIVDNFSSDSSLIHIKEWIRDKNKSYFKIIKNKFNYGYSKGNNIGISYALNQNDCKNLWILNNDCTVHKNALEELIKSDANFDSHGIWGSKVLYPNGRIQSLGCRINNKFMLTYHNYNNSIDKKTDFKIDRIDYIHGCSMFFNKIIIEKIGYLPEQYFMFFDDVDFCKKALDEGINLNISQNSIVIHEEGVSIKKNKLEYLALINRIKFAKKYFPSKLFYVYLGICFEIIKSIFLLRFYLAKKIILNFKK